MELTSLIVVLKPAIDGVKGALRLSRKALGKRKYDQLVSAVIAELLKEVPDVDAAEARLKAVEATGVEPDMHLLRARSMLSKAKLFRWRGPSAGAGGDMSVRWAKKQWAKNKVRAKKQNDHTGFGSRAQS
jgi:hypothetical protein